MGYRPLCDFWLLARAKLANGEKRYGSYLGGFPERARALLGATINDPVLHVCGGMARQYPYAAGFGEYDKTLDLDVSCDPDYLRDAREPLPVGFKAMLCDPPYSVEDSRMYPPGDGQYPLPNKLVANMLAALRPGERCGIIHYILPSPPKGSRFVAAVGIVPGFNNRIRIYSVFEKGEEQ